MQCFGLMLNSTIEAVIRLRHERRDLINHLFRIPAPVVGNDMPVFLIFFSTPRCFFCMQGKEVDGLARCGQLVAQ